MKGLELI
jgi:hypothetical protein